MADEWGSGGGDSGGFLSWSPDSWQPPSFASDPTGGGYQSPSPISSSPAPDWQNFQFQPQSVPLRGAPSPNAPAWQSQPAIPARGSNADINQMMSQSTRWNGVAAPLWGQPMSSPAQGPMDMLPFAAAMRLYHGAGGAAAGGAGGGWFSTNPQRAASYGPKVSYVDVPDDVYAAGQKAARAAGSGTSGDAILPALWQRLMRAYEGVKPTTFNID